MQKIMPGLLEVLSGYINQPLFGQRALTLLGKFGGRSHAHINGPQPIEYYNSTDKGLRPVFVFKPSTSCLVPLDVCINLLVKERKGLPGEATKHYRVQAFHFVASCLNRVLNMDGHTTETKEALDEQIGSLLAQTDIPFATYPWSCTAKTTQQYIAEEKVVEVRMRCATAWLRVAC
jgi:hypothetical protein